MTNHRRQLTSLVIGVAITPFALAAAIESVGGGHGGYVLAKILFPYSMLLTTLTGTITYTLMGLAIVQFPLYGLAVGSFNATRTAISFLVMHAIASYLCFSSLLQNFG